MVITDIENKVTYSARAIGKIDYQPGAWHGLRVGVFRNDDDSEQQVGEYNRNHPNLYRTFFHFKKDGKDYALYSRDYPATRVMELPSCKDIGGEEPDGDGFCPVDFYVPCGPLTYYPFGFVAGCIWADDSSWKIQYLDLSDVERGVIKRDARFGYIEMPHHMNLKDCIRMDNYGKDPEAEWSHRITIAIQQHFDLRTGSVVNLDPFKSA